MRKVVDSNFLRSQGLREYLAASPKNLVLLTDYAAMEAYKGNTLLSIQGSMEILAEFPSQVLVLKNTLVACGLRGRASGLKRRFVDKSQTEGFSIYCRQLAAARAGNTVLAQKLLEHGEEARRHLEGRMLSDAATLPATIESLAKDYTPQELIILRNNEPYSDEMIKKLVLGVLHTAVAMLKSHPRVQHFPDQKEMPNTFIFRAALTAYLLALDWIAIGGPKAAIGASHKKLRNDMVDINFVAYATYFDDLLTNDQKTIRIYDKARLLLWRVFGCQISGMNP